MTNDEIVRLIIQIAGKADAKEMQQELLRLKESLETVDEAGKKAGKGFGNVGIEISRIVQDGVAGFGMNGLSGAIMATNNNVEGLLRSLGAGAGLIGIISLVAGLTPLVVNAFAAMFKTDPVEEFATRIDQLKGELKKLEEKPIKLVADLEQIQRLRKEIDDTARAKRALDALMGAQNEQEKAAGKAFDEAIGGTPGAREALDAARRQMSDEAVGMAPGVPEARGRVRDARRALQEEMASEELNEPFLRQEKEKALREAEAAAAKAEGDVRTEIDRRIGADVEAARSGTGAAQAAAQARIREALLGQGDAGRAAAARMALGGARPNAGGDVGDLADIGGAALDKAMGFGAARDAKDAREQAEAMVRGPFDAVGDAMPGFRRAVRDQRQAEAEAAAKARADAAARAEAKAREMQQAREFDRDNPTAGPEMRQRLAMGDNTPDAVAAEAKRLVESGALPADAAARFALQQSQELQQEFQRYLDVLRNRNAAASAVLNEIRQELENLRREAREEAMMFGEFGGTMQRRAGR